MADDTIFYFQNIVNARYNSFTKVWTPSEIGYGVVPAEIRTIPNTPPYIINLFESPEENSPSTTEITLLPSTVLEEVSSTTTLGNNQYRVQYEPLGNGQVEFNAAQAGQQVSIKYYGLGTGMQKETMIVRFQGSGASKVIASSDSGTSSKSIADLIIDTGENAGDIINTVFTDLVSTVGGGEILLLEGLYNIETSLYIPSACTLRGSGANTILKRNSTIDQVVDFTLSSNAVLRDLSIDGNKTTYNSGTRNGVSSGDETCRILNVACLSNYGDGFYNCSNVSDCMAADNNIGYTSCELLVNCVSFGNVDDGFNSIQRGSNLSSFLNGDDGFRLCNFLTNCYSYSNTGKGFSGGGSFTTCYALQNTGDGYAGVSILSSCVSNSNSAQGFNGCSYMSACSSSGNAFTGYQGCDDISSSLADGNSQSGFQNCRYLNGNTSINNSLYGYASCNSMQQNTQSGNTSGGYQTCYADKAGSYAIAVGGTDTPNGGFNS